MTVVTIQNKWKCLKCSLQVNRWGPGLPVNPKLSHNELGPGPLLSAFAGKLTKENIIYSVYIHAHSIICHNTVCFPLHCIKTRR